MPIGQFKTRRKEETGRVESIPEEERQDLLTEAGVPELPGAQPPPLPPAPDPFITAAKESMQGEPVPGEAEPTEEEGPAGGGVLGKVGRVAGAAIGGAPGAAVGGAAGFLLGAAIQKKPTPIGTLEGGSVTQEDNSDTLRQLLAVQQKIARAGTPIKDAIQTQAAGSRL